MKNLHSTPGVRKAQPVFLLIFFLGIMPVLLAQQIPVFDWAGAFAGTDTERGTSITLDASGNVYAAGSFNGNTDLDPGIGVLDVTSAGGNNVYVSKLDAAGNLIWARTMGGTIGADAATATSIDLDPTGNVYITGYFRLTVDFDPGPGVYNLTAGGQEDIFIIKLDNAGNFIWARAMGGPSREMAFDIAIDALGNVHTTGPFWGTTDFDPGAGDFSLTATGNYGIFVSKLDTNGNFVWAKGTNGSGTSNIDAGHSIGLDASGNVFVTGVFRGTVDFNPGAPVFNLTSNTAGYTDVFIFKLDASGNFLWAKSIGGFSWDYGNALALDGAGNVYATGYYSSAADFDPGPGIFTLPDYGKFVFKLDGNGDFVWAKSIVGNFLTRGCLTLDASANVYAAGSFAGTTDFDPGTGVYNITAATHDTFIVKLDINGNFVWATSVGGATFQDEVLAITVDASENVVATGTFVGLVDFDPGACIYNLTATGPADAFIQRFSMGTALSSPTITSFSPASGPVGTAVTITGTNFSTASANNLVTFHNNITAIVTASTSTSINTSVPAGSITGKITVTTNCITATSATDFTIGTAPSPTITSFTPTSGVVGSTVTITGTNFSATPADNTVMFNGTAAVVSASTSTDITTTVPVGATTGQILVTVSGNTATSSGNFTVLCGLDPTITSFSPSSGITGTTVIITGTNFSTTPEENIVDFNGTVAVVTASTATTITTTVPAGANGTGSISVAVGCNTATSSSDFTVLCGLTPTITSFSPSSGTIGTTVIITGTNFSATPEENIVDFNGTVSVVTASTATSITTTVPAGASGTGPVSVGVGCNTATSSSDFTVLCGLTPTITSFSPSSGSTGTTVIITGTNFSTTPEENIVDFNGTVSVVTASTATSITTTVPVGASGTGPISVAVGCNTTSSTDDFTVICPPAPTITSFSPTFGTTGTSVTITGTSFSTTPTENLVAFNGVSAVVTSATSTSITAEVPAGATPGPIAITIDCNSVTSATNFDVIAIITITNQPDDVIVCEGEVAIFSATATGPDNITYQWQYSPDGISPFTDVVDSGVYSGATTSMLSANTSGNTGAGYYRCYITGDLATPVVTDEKELLINAMPSAPVGGSSSRCDSGSITLEISGGTDGQYKWYDVPLDGTAIDGEVNNTYTTPILSVTTIYYATIISSDCESQRTPVTATIISSPSPPATTGASTCPGGAVILTASGGTNGQYKWYSEETGGSALPEEGNDSYTTPELTTTTTYYVSVTDNGCESLRTSVTATVLTIGCAPVITNEVLTTQPEGKIILDLKPLIATAGTLDVNSISVIEMPPSGALAVVENGILTIDYTGIPFSGTESITIEACNTNGICSQQNFSIEVAGDIIVYNAISPNGDDKNPIFRIQFIDVHPDTRTNEVFIYNRWGDEVFSISDYDNKTRVFSGLANDGNELPSGIYFYKIILSLQNKTLTGFIDLRF